MNDATIPQGWIPSTVGESAEILDSRRVPLNSEERRIRAGEIPYWGANGIVDYIDDFIFDEPLVLMAEDGGYFDQASTRPICHRLDGPVWVNNHAHIIRPVNVERDYFYYWFVHRDITPSIKGGTRSKLNQADLKQLPILLPPLDEQRRIAEVLRSVDDAIAAHEKAAQQQASIRQGLNSLFLKGIGHNDFQWTELGEIPSSWKVRTMKEVCTNVGVGIASSATHAYVETGVPMLRNQNIRGGHIDLTDLLFVTAEYDQSYKTKRVRTGDVITMRTGYPGRSAVIPNELNGCQTFTTLISRPRHDVIDPNFLCGWINSIPGTIEVRKRQAGGAQQNLNAGSLEQLPVPLPPLEEQRAIASIFRQFPTEDDMLIADLHSTKKALMTDLLSGRVRVPA